MASARDSIVSYGGCEILYYVGGDIADVEGLFSTTLHNKFLILLFGIECAKQQSRYRSVNLLIRLKGS